MNEITISIPVITFSAMPVNLPDFLALPPDHKVVAKCGDSWGTGATHHEAATAAITAFSQGAAASVAALAWEKNWEEIYG